MDVKRERLSLGRLFIIAVVFFALFVLVAIVNRSVPPSTSFQKDSGINDTVLVGESGRLHSGAELVPVAVDRDAFDAWTKARIANDTFDMDILLGTELVLTPKAGTRVLVIDRGLFIEKVRILEGEYQFQTGWVSSEYIRK